MKANWPAAGDVAALQLPRIAEELRRDLRRAWADRRFREIPPFWIETAAKLLDAVAENGKVSKVVSHKVKRLQRESAVEAFKQAYMDGATGRDDAMEKAAAAMRPEITKRMMETHVAADEEEAGCTYSMPLRSRRLRDDEGRRAPNRKRK